MTYNPNIPLSTDLISTSQSEIKDNFTQLNDQFKIDHTAFYVAATSANGDGFHKQVTMVTFGAFPYAVAADKSYIGSAKIDAGGLAGTQLVYQPSIVNSKVPLSPRSMARITNNPSGTFALGNGPYGAGTNFNAIAPVAISTTSFTYNFFKNMPDTDYFVFISVETTGFTHVPRVSSRAVGSFVISGTPAVAGSSTLIMVY